MMHDLVALAGYKFVALICPGWLMIKGYGDKSR
jgi:hypothetical protein